MRQPPNLHGFGKFVGVLIVKLETDVTRFFESIRAEIHLRTIATPTFYVRSTSNSSDVVEESVRLSSVVPVAKRSRINWR